MAPCTKCGINVTTKFCTGCGSLAPTMTAQCSGCGTAMAAGQKFCTRCGLATAAGQACSCGAALAPGAKFCRACGKPAASGCSKCGAALSPGAKFCRACGTPVQASNLTRTGTLFSSGLDVDDRPASYDGGASRSSGRPDIRNAPHSAGSQNLRQALGICPHGNHRSMCPEPECRQCGPAGPQFGGAAGQAPVDVKKMVYKDETGSSIVIEEPVEAPSAAYDGFDPPPPSSPPSTARAEESARPTGDGTYEVGDDVEVHSLQKRPEYNGKGGKLVAFDAQAGRWEVRLQGGSSLRVYMCVCM